MTEVNIMMQIAGVGGVVARPALSSAQMETLLDSVAQAPPQPRSLFYHVMGKFIENMPQYISDQPPPDVNQFIQAVWYRVLAHPRCGVQLRTEIRRLLREMQDHIRVTWWIKDLDHPDFVFLGHEFQRNHPDFNSTPPL